MPVGPITFLVGAQKSKIKNEENTNTIRWPLNWAAAASAPKVHALGRRDTNFARLQKIWNTTVSNRKRKCDEHVFIQSRIEPECRATNALGPMDGVL